MVLKKLVLKGSAILPGVATLFKEDTQHFGVLLKGSAILPGVATLNKMKNLALLMLKGSAILPGVATMMSSSTIMKIMS